jgi:hypothetical protein
MAVFPELHNLLMLDILTKIAFMAQHFARARSVFSINYVLEIQLRR